MSYIIPRLPAIIVCVGAIAVLAAGCGRENQLETIKVTGRVTLDGQPLGSGTVVFMPQKGPGAKGTIGSDGSFRMGTYAEGDGAVAGRHQVAVIALDPKAMAAAKGPDAYVPSLIPERYNSSATSGLTFEVKPGIKNVADIEITRR
ncbi:MAG: hypothetical protein K8R46_03595 [Pirellulales bacterium]|nr:hypothetical protein [Pirellulales bacterium]